MLNRSLAHFRDRGRGSLAWRVRVPSIGIASDTWGRVSVTMLWNTVSESRMVTPATQSRKGPPPGVSDNAVSLNSD